MAKNISVTYNKAVYTILPRVIYTSHIIRPKCPDARLIQHMHCYAVLHKIMELNDWTRTQGRTQPKNAAAMHTTISNTRSRTVLGPYGLRGI